MSEEENSVVIPVEDTEKSEEQVEEHVAEQQRDQEDFSDEEFHEEGDQEQGQEEQGQEETDYEAKDDDVLQDEDFSKLKARKRKNIPEEDIQQTAKRTTTDDFHDEGVNDDDDSKVHRSNESFSDASKRRQELEARLERALKKPKMKKRKDEHDLTNDDDELIQILKNQMDTAAKKDAELIETQSGIAVNKIQLLPKVRAILSKVNLAEVILDNNLLLEVRQWLEPLPDASLPSYEIQKVLFSALLKLPINTNHLRESGIGKILLFYQKSKRVEPKIKRVADKLISDWTRPIIGASDNYRDKQISSIEFDHQRLRNKSKLQSSSNTKDIEKSIYEQQAARRNRAAAPAPTVTDYKFAPKSRVDRSATSIMSAGVGTSLNRDDQFKRINQKLSGRRTTTKKGGVSIEGRSSGF